jgi:hypothetical protein
LRRFVRRRGGVGFGRAISVWLVWEADGRDGECEVFVASGRLFAGDSSADPVASRCTRWSVLVRVCTGIEARSLSQVVGDDLAMLEKMTLGKGGQGVCGGPDWQLKWFVNVCILGL